MSGWTVASGSHTRAPNGEGRRPPGRELDGPTSSHKLPLWFRCCGIAFFPVCAADSRSLASFAVSKGSR